MKAFESAVMDRGDARGVDLMERAGRGVVEEVFRFWPSLYDIRNGQATILCGPGNNGGDGFVVARLLAGRGWRIRVLFLGTEDRLPADAARNFQLWRDLGAVIPVMEGPDPEAVEPPDLVVDALFGTGLTRPLEPGIADLLARWLAVARHSVAIDILSGLCADSGRRIGGVPLPGPADQPKPSDLPNPAHLPGPIGLTVSFHSAKAGHMLSDGARISGALRIVDIGLPEGAVPVARLVGMAQAAPAAVKDAAAHKYGHGHAVILSGPATRTGAARLAARAALRIGAGLGTLAAPASALPEIAAQITALMLRQVGDAEDLQHLLADQRLNALCLGPGLGTGAVTRALVATALAADRATVLDADALGCWGEDRDILLQQTAGRSVVLTPHDGEFARLFPDLADRLRAPAPTGPAFSRIDAARIAAERAGACLLLKGPGTVIAAPDGRVAVHAALRDRAAPWLATAGSGDVLAGLITGLLARGLPPYEAACAAAWLHVEAARHHGPGLIAEDLPEALPAVLASLADATAPK